MLSSNIRLSGHYALSNLLSWGGLFLGISPIPLAFGPISLYFIYDIGRPQGRYPNKLTKTIQRKKNCQATSKWPFKQIKSQLLFYQLIVLNQPLKLIKNIHQQRFFIVETYSNISRYWLALQILHPSKNYSPILEFVHLSYRTKTFFIAFLST